MIEKKRKSTGKITLNEVAQSVGISAMTVSRALRKPESVAPQLREKIHEAINKLGYVPNIQARNLASAHSNLVTAIVPSFSSHGIIQIAEFTQQELIAHDYTMMYMEMSKGRMSEDDALRQMIAYNPAAIIQFNVEKAHCSSEMISNFKLPVIEVGAINHEPINISIGIDYAKAVKKLVNYLIESEFKSIGLLCTPSNSQMFQQVLSGWNSAMLSFNHSPHRVLTTHLPSSISTGYDLFNEIRMTWPELDALICTSDDIACGCIMACHSNGIAIPETLALASIGGGSLAAVCSPPLTTVEFPWKEMGITAGKTIINHLNGEKVENIIELESNLVVRTSTTKSKIGSKTR